MGQQSQSQNPVRKFSLAASSSSGMEWYPFHASRQLKKISLPGSGTGTAVAMRLVSRDASADLLQNLFNRLKSITRRGVLSRFGTTIIGASQRSWLFFAETLSSIPILTASSRSFFVFSFRASGVAITLVVRLAFIALCSSFSSTVIFGTCIIGRVWVWHTFIALPLNSFLKNSCSARFR